MHIQYTLRNGTTPRTMRLPAVADAVRKAPSQRNTLEIYIARFGVNHGAEKYCRECFTLSNMKSLEIHDDTGCVAKLI